MPLPAETKPAPTLPSPPASDPPEGFAVVGYFPDYREVNPEWGRHLTDILYFSAEPDADGGLDTGRLDEDDLNALHEMQVRYGVRVHLSIGGWERSENFAAMSGDAQARARFLVELATYVHENKINGVDFDWEFPEDEAELQNYILLLEEVREDFQPKGLTVSVALSPDFQDSLASYAIADRIHIMSYDRGERHATYEQAVTDVQTFIDAGIPPEKLILGLPFYGRSVAPPWRVLAYSEIIERYHPASDLDEVDGVFFNNVGTIRRKTCHALDNGLGGVMVWELAHDSMDDKSLLRAISQVLKDGCLPPK